MEDLVDLRPTVEPEEVLPDIDAHEYLVGVYRGLIQPNGSRLKAAIAALPFERPERAVVATTTPEVPAERFQKALSETAKLINSRPTQVIPPPPVIDVSLEPLPDHSAPFAQNTKHRFRRF